MISLRGNCHVLVSQVSLSIGDIFDLGCSIMWNLGSRSGFALAASKSTQF